MAFEPIGKHLLAGEWLAEAGSFLRPVSYQKRLGALLPAHLLA